MTDLTQILAGNVDEVTKALAPLTIEQLTELKALEEADKNRKGVLTAIAAALEALAGAPTNSDSADTASASASDETAGATVVSSTDVAEEPLDEIELTGAPLVFDDPVPLFDPATITLERIEPVSPVAVEPVAPEEPASSAPSIDLSHPAVDANLRAGTSTIQNQIDFNDPSADGREVVEAALAAQNEG